MSLSTQSIQCPYCGEMIEVDVESMSTVQSYIEDCSVCCRPIQVTVMPGADDPEIAVSRSE